MEKSIPVAGEDFYAFYNGNALEITTSLGVSLSLNFLYEAKVIVNPTFKYEVKGFCGNYDENENNDLALKDGTAVKLNKNLDIKAAGTLIGESWAYANDSLAVDGLV